MMPPGPFWLNWIWWAYLAVWLQFTPAALLYGFRSAWHRSPMGRALMTLLGSMSAILTFVLIVLAVPMPTIVADILRGVTLAGVAVAGHLLLRRIWVIQRAARDDPSCPRRRSTDIP